MSGKITETICPLCQQVISMCECDFDSQEYADKLKSLTFEEAEDYMRMLRNSAHSNQVANRKRVDPESRTYNPDYGKTPLGYWKR